MLLLRKRARKSHLDFHAVRGDIYAFSNGRIVGLPRSAKKFGPMMEDLCREIMAGTKPIYPAGHIPYEAGAAMMEGNPYLVDNYCQRIKKRGGAFAILMAFHVSQSKVLTKQQIIATGQHFCDEQMEENFHAGRPRGAWAGNTQLQNHGLITVQKNVTYNERAGGLRNNGVHRYTLTPNGQLFIDALLELNPGIRQQIDAAGGGRRGDPGGPDMSMDRNGPGVAGTYASGVATQLIRNPYAASATGVLPRLPSAGSTPKKSSKLAENDERELRAWAGTARIGQQKEFQVGKDRRKHLHDVCDNINRLLTGRRLMHESAGGTRARSLFVTVVATNSASSSADEFLMFGPPPSLNFDMPVKTSPPRPASRGRLLGESPVKRQAVLPPREAAALAALERQAYHESREASNKPAARSVVSPSPNTNQCSSSPDMPQKLAPHALKSMKSSWSTTKPACRQLDPSNVVCLLDDSSDEEDRKPPAKPPAARNIFREEIDDGDDDDSIPESVLHNKAPANDLGKDVDGLIIYIDDRERNRNHTPRLLRTELTRLLTSGQLSMIWPVKPTPTVVESHLRSGDFSFAITKGDREMTLPVLVERKRIGDLVQRSTKKDHWYQLQTMRWASTVNVLLLEGDPRTCTQFIAYGAQEVDVPSPFSHTIDDEDSLYLFMGRALLNGTCVTLFERCTFMLFFSSVADRSGSMMFVQSKDEQSSLRFIASIGLMALSCIPAQATAMTPIDTKSAAQALSKKLRDDGIPYQLAGRIADEFVDISCLDQLYESIDEAEGRDLVLLPLIEDLCEDTLPLTGTAQSWSRAIHRAWTSKAGADVTERLQSISHLAEDQAALLSKLHDGLSNEEALEDLFNDGAKKPPALVRRVTVKLPADCVDLFPSPGGDGFFRLEAVDHKRDDRALPCISMQTRAGGFASMPLHIFLLDGKRFVNIVQRKLTFSNDCIIAARTSAKEINIWCRRAAIMNDTGRRIILVRALGNAVDQAAKQADFRFETRMVVELTLAELMVEHRTVTLQAVRIKDDQEMMLRQLALACFRFQLLTIKIP
jgi:hypothetical protein